MPCDRPCSRSSSRPKTQAGNILFLILLAVVLFAALASAVTSSLRGGGKDASSESYASKIADIESYVAGMQSTIMRMTLTGGVPLHEIDFNTSARLAKNGSASVYNNTTCTTTKCEVHHIDGGGLTYRDFNKYGSSLETVPDNFLMRGHNYVRLERWENVGTDLPDLILWFEGLDIGLGRAINMKYHGINNISVSSTGTSQVFSNAITSTMLNDVSTGTSRTGADISGKMAWCGHSINNPTQGTYSNCYFVIMAR